MKAFSLIRAAVVAMAITLPLTAFAQAYPAKPIRIVIPYPPGGAGDAIARAMAQKMGENLKQTAVIDNRPGASQIIAAQAVTSAAPDGYTLLMASGTSLVLNPLTKKALPYDPAKDLELISKWASAPNFLLVSPSLGVNSVQELVQLARSKPGTVNFGSIGNGSNLHIAGEMLASMAKLNLLHIPYKGTAPALTDLVSGQLNMLFDPGTAGLQMARNGRLKLLAVTSEKRIAQFPETPTMIEAGIPGYEIDSWWGLATPAGTPPAIVNQLAAAVAYAVASPSLSEKFSKEGISFESSTPVNFTKFVQGERTKWTKRMAELKIESN
jgi:tripartite-type tricarboxylate transporter receptor subunit TctC